MALRRKPGEKPLGDADAELADGERVPVAWSELSRIPRIKMRYVTVFIFGIIAVAFFRGQQTLPITKSCTTAAFTVEEAKLQKHNLARFSMTGPEGSYVLGFNLSAIKVKADGAFQLVPKEGVPVGGFQLGGKVQTLKKCLAHDLFAINLEAGQHEIEMFRFPAAGTAGEATLVSSRTVTVGEAKQR